MPISAYAMPALIALLLKGVIYIYARQSGLRNTQTRLYLCFLITLSIQNVAEILAFSAIGHDTNIDPAGKLYFAAGILAIALLLHLSLVLALDWQRQPDLNRYTPVFYVPAVILELLLLFGDSLVIGFEPMSYSYTRIPGSLYYLFELYVLLYLVTTISVLIYGGLQQSTPIKRLKAKIMLSGLVPLLLLVIGIIIYQHYGMRDFNTTVTVPIAFTLFLIVTAYAIHHHRLFDILFYIPWSKVRKRKTAFYHRIHQMIAEIADLNSVNDIIERLADTLHCPVALLSGNRAVLAASDNAKHMSQIPRVDLEQLDHIVVAQEIENAMPRIYQDMKQHHVAAIVPFYPHSQHTSGWLLLGDSFNDTVYTPLDFRLIEELFDKMGDLFLDKQLLMRTQLSKSRRELRSLRQDYLQVQSTLEQLRKEKLDLETENRRLLKELPASNMGLSKHQAPEQLFGSTLVFLGRDKTMREKLRKHYPQIKSYVGPDSAGFRRMTLPDILVCCVEGYSDKQMQQLSQTISKASGTSGMLFYGADAETFATRFRQQLLGTISEVLPYHTSQDGIIRRVTALTEAQKYLFAAPQSDYPLLSKDPIYREAMFQAQHIARFNDPILLIADHVPEAISIARYIYQQRACEGEFAVLQAEQLRPENIQELVLEILEKCRNGIVMLDNLNKLDSSLGKQLLLLANETDNVSFIVGSDNPEAEVARSRLTWHTLNIPSLRQRIDDIQPLAYYYTLQFNLQSGSSHYLSQREVDSIINNTQPANLSALKSRVFERLGNKNQQLVNEPEMDYSVNNKTLDEYVATFEAEMIKQTLERCDGNKSKAARLLGLRPNTLHYKLERYGISDTKKKSK